MYTDGPALQLNTSESTNNAGAPYVGAAAPVYDPNALADIASPPQAGGGAAAPSLATGPTVNVKDYGAVGDGVTDDTAAIQRALKAVSGTGGTVEVPDGVYMIDDLANPYMGNHGLEIDGAMTLSLSANATLQAKPGSADNFATILVAFTDNVNIEGGTILGNRQSTSYTGQWGTGIEIMGSSHVAVRNVTSSENWGDGFYVGGGSSDVTLDGVTADHNGRHGLAITSADGVVVNSSVFENAVGTDAATGIDIEPNVGDTVNNVTIENSTFLNNAGGGFQSGVPVAETGAATVSNIVFDHNDVEGNGVNPPNAAFVGAVVVTNSDGQQVTNNVVHDNVGEGIVVSDKATHAFVSGNTITGTVNVAGFDYWTGGGIYIVDGSGSSVTNNIVTDNAGFGILDALSDPSLEIQDNTVSGNAKSP